MKQSSGEGYPDADDLQQVRGLADRLLSRFATGRPSALPAERLDFQPRELAAENAF
jgi:hypothetical protein